MEASATPTADEERAFPQETRRDQLCIAEMVLMPRIVQPECGQAGLRDASGPAVFEEKELVDLTIAISLMNAYNRLAIGFRNTPRAALET
jgi:hypothetical protein